MRLYRIFQGSDERNTPKTGESACPPSWTVLKLKLEFSHLCPCSLLSPGPQLGHQRLDRGLGEEPALRVPWWPHLCSFHRGTRHEHETSLSFWTPARALQWWKMVSATFGWSLEQSGQRGRKRRASPEPRRKGRECGVWTHRTGSALIYLLHFA